eukprot:g37793.t1
MSGESAVSPVPAASTRTTSFKGASPSSKYVKLNVGGALYYTTMQTLTKQDTMLKAMFSGRMEVLTDSEELVLKKLYLGTLVPKHPKWGRGTEGRRGVVGGKGKEGCEGRREERSDGGWEAGGGG